MRDSVAIWFGEWQQGSSLLHKLHAGRTSAESGDDVVLICDLGLDVVRKVVGIVAREHLATRHGRLGLGRPHLLDVFLVRGIDDRGDVEVGLAVPAREVDLAEHAGRVLVTLLDGVEVTDVGLGEVDSGLLSAADSDSVDVGRARVGGEVDGADLIVKGPESDLASADSGGERGNEAEGGSREMHGEIVFVTKKKESVNLVTCAEWTQREDMNVV